MRQYLLAAEGQEKLAREDKVRKSISDLMDDPIGQKTFLRLEPTPIISKALDKGKGVVYDFSAQKEQVVNTKKLMASAISAGMKVLQSGKIVSEHPISEMAVNSTQSKFLPEGSTGYSVGFYETCTSGTSLKKPKRRRRPGTYKRKGNGKRIQKEDVGSGKKIGEGVVTDYKRKANEDVEPSKSSARFKKPMVVPNEGPSKI